MTINRAKAAIAKREANLQRLKALLAAERRLNTCLLYTSDAADE